MTCERCNCDAEPGSKLCGQCECDDRNVARRALAPAPCSASGLLTQWQQALQEREQALSSRLDNMFLGPMGIEEKLSVMQNDVKMDGWFLGKLIKIIADIESKMPNDKVSDGGDK